MPDNSLCKYLKISNSDIQNENSELLIGRATTVCGIQIPSSTHLCDFVNNNVYVVSTKQNRNQNSYNKSKNQKGANKSKKPALTRQLRSHLIKPKSETSSEPEPEPQPEPEPEPQPEPEPEPEPDSEHRAEVKEARSHGISQTKINHFKSLYARYANPQAN